MVHSLSTRSALTAIGAGALAAALVFLFFKTEAIDFRGDARALGVLREMKDIDARWDVDAARLANDLATGNLAMPDRARMMATALRALESGSIPSAVATQLPALRKGIAEKEAAYNLLKDAHARTRVAFQESIDALRVLQIAAAGKAHAGATAERGAALDALVAQLRSAVRGTDVEEVDATFAALEPRLAVLRLSATSLDPALGEPAGRAEYAVRRFMSDRRDEASAWQKLAYLTVGGRIDLVGRDLARSIEASLDEKERWRVYLFAYAAALLIGVGYLGARVVAAQTALREANAELEARVNERTRDLSQTLKRLQESEAQLVQSEKMSSLGQMVAGVAHEINTPLAYVKNSVATVRDRMPHLHGALDEAERLIEALHAEPPNPEDVAAILEALEASLERLRRERALEDLDGLTRDGLHGIDAIVELVKNLRNFARLDRSKVASFNVNEGVQATLLIARSGLRKVDVEQHLGEVPSITCSPSQVNQVLLNLLNNSAQAMDKPRGRIVVTTRPVGTTAVAIDVEDNGRGIPAESLPKVFDPFFTTKDPGKGTGLGLSIAYKIVNEHGGKIEIRSSVGVGTLVTVTLPIHPPSELASAQAEALA